MNRNAGIGKLVPLAVGAAAAAISAPTSWAEDEGEFEEAQLFFELNDTDGDLGIHGLIDGDAWKWLEIEDPNEQSLMNVWIRGRLRNQGLTEIFFESAEPGFDELSPAKFFKRFPEGTYEIEATTLAGTELEGEVELSHTLAAPPDIEVNGTPVDDGCDEPLPSFGQPIMVDWDPVTMSHPALGNTGEAVTVQQYEVVGEIERAGKTPELLVMSVILPPNRNRFQFPKAFTSLADGEFKFEIVTKLNNGNQTAVEACIEIL